MSQGVKVFKFPEVNKEWLLLRQKYITATESACLFQMGNMSAATLMETKMTDPEPIKNEFMLIGNIMEDSVLNSFKHRAGINALPADPDNIIMLVRDDIRLSATPDGKAVIDGIPYLIECKTIGGMSLVNAKKRFLTWLDNPPLNYILQVQTQLLVSGVDQAMIGGMAYFFPVPFIIYEIRKSEKVHELLSEYAKRFWHCFETDEIYEVTEEVKTELKEALIESCEILYLSHEFDLDTDKGIW